MKREFNEFFATEISVRRLVSHCGEFKLISRISRYAPHGELAKTAANSIEYLPSNKRRLIFLINGRDWSSSTST
jgi:hypothetical protein